MNTSEYHTLNSISPVDGRYAHQTQELAQYFSEFSLFKYRVKVEIEYLIALNRLGVFVTPEFTNVQVDQLRHIYSSFSQNDAVEIKTIEKTTNHDVKAVEYFIKNKLKQHQLEAYTEQVHFGLTSQDINNTAIPLSLKDANAEQVFPFLKQLADLLSKMAHESAETAMLARTHGQPASPTTLGKELFVFVERIHEQIKGLSEFTFNGKFGGATGNLNAHAITFPEINWADFANQFLNDLGLNRSQTTTQIEHYDGLADYFHKISRINTILIDLCRDVWMYVSMDYFKQKIKAGEVGSSAMPHKVNPIDFENAEGNLGIANALFYHFAEKLPISRLQRDLSDSTVLRNVGVPLAHSLLAYKSILRGLNKLYVNTSKISNDLENHWEVVAEGIQNILRRENYPEPYEKLKELTRKNTQITSHDIAEFIARLDVSESVKAELNQITPFNYIGIHPWKK